MCFIIETGKETALLREKEAKRRFRRAKISGLEELIYTIIFLFFVCFIGIIILAYSWNKLSSFLFLIYFKFGKAGSGETGLLFLYSIKFKHLLWEFT